MHLHYLEFVFSSAADKWFAFKNLGRPDVHFNEIKHIKFYRALGTGSGNGFSIIPSLSKYGFLMAIDAEGSSSESVWQSSIFNRYKSNCDSYLHVIGTPIKSHGMWNGANPFSPSSGSGSSDGPIAVITRATIRPRRMIEFWRHVPKTSKFMYNNPASLYQTGIGEYPLFMQATFSLWRSKKLLIEAAYSDTIHGEIVKRTRLRNWYKEELFAEFSLNYIKTDGDYYPESLQTISGP